MNSIFAITISGVISLVIFNFDSIIADESPRITRPYIEEKRTHKQHTRKETKEPSYHKEGNPAEISDFDLSDIKKYFNQFNSFYGMTYNDNNLKTKYYNTFEDNVKRYSIMNKFTTSAKFRINEFSHLTLEEFTDLYTGFNDTHNDNVREKKNHHNSANKPPLRLNWRDLGLGSSIKNQGPCRMSYVTSAIANIEAQYAKKFNHHLKLSHKQGFACETKGNCKNGGLPHLVMEGLMKAGGAISDSDYHHGGRSDDKVCNKNDSLVKVNVTGVTRLKLDEDGLLAALNLNGPLVTTIFVSESVKNYHSGLLEPTDCDSKPNHAVLLVGYDETSDKKPYWIIQNSWGKRWGEQGYLRLTRGERACNIGYYVATASVAKYNPKPIQLPTPKSQNLLVPDLQLANQIIRGLLENISSTPYTIAGARTKEERIDPKAPQTQESIHVNTPKLTTTSSQTESNSNEENEDYGFKITKSLFLRAPNDDAKETQEAWEGESKRSEGAVPNSSNESSAPPASEVLRDTEVRSSVVDS